MIKHLSSFLLKTSRSYRSIQTLSSLPQTLSFSTCSSNKTSSCSQTNQTASCSQTNQTSSCSQTTKTSPCQSASNAIPMKKTETGNSDFYIEQIFTGCLAEYSYYIDSEGEALVIDPIYDNSVYVELAAQRGSKIKYILETHFHADFVSGHIDLAKKTGAQIIFGPLSKAAFKFHLAKDLEVFKLGKAEIQVLHTPGHTLESSCFVLKDSKGVPHSVYTGDTLFLNEVGRPDLAANDILKPEDMAKKLYESIRNKLMALPDNVLVFPGHGAGSPCGKSIGAGDFSSIGEQKLSNYAMMKDLNKEEFIKIASSNLPRPLGYMGYDVSLNKGTQTLREIKEIMNSGKKNFAEFKALCQEKKNLVVLDTRDDISKGFLENSLNIGLNMTFSIFVGTLINNESPIFVISENNKKTEEAIIRLLRVGYDKIVGYLDGGFETWTKNNGGLYPLQTIDAEKFKEIYQSDKNAKILDIRNRVETDDGILSGAKLVPLRDIEHEILKGTFNALKNQKMFMHCRSGPRAIIAYSLFRKYGFQNVVNVLGGFNKMKELGFNIVKPSS